jgi:hypothetical protein
MENLFEKDGARNAVKRINNLSKDSAAKWGKMNVAQMLAHCNVPYEYVYENKYPKPGFIKKTLLKIFVKSAVVGPKPYKKNSPTAPDFKIKGEREFEREKGRLIEFIARTQELGELHFDNKESHSFGKLSKEEWNTMFVKHLDHHLKQFGV